MTAHPLDFAGLKDPSMPLVRLVTLNRARTVDVLSLPAAAPDSYWDTIAAYVNEMNATVVATALEPTTAQEPWAQKHYKRVRTRLEERGWRSRIDVISELNIGRILDAD
ncbi:hypothetical protein [Curtobacterium flaccumfaciens]|uniref:hypothetical protein n=1 Tax=Curtobacterium flaccumfaciens TaxID=2035 RepID=UPI00217E2E84|nr:hypothetical protein [Curtobacterium flaccumfaciens]MCS6588118.1 hypothetical protein [Curtobacterium flaccumfaciens pv. flaccumfaciens]